MSLENNVIAMSPKDNTQAIAEIRGEIDLLNARTTNLEKQIDIVEDNKLILGELKIIINELVEWRKASENKIQQQNDSQIKMTMILEQLSADTQKHDQQLDSVRNSINDMNAKGSISFNDILRKAFFYILTSFLGLVIGILGWGPK